MTITFENAFADQPDIAHFLQPGRQTEADAALHALAAEIQGSTDEKVEGILAVTQSLNLTEYDPNIFRKRKASEIYADGYVSGGTDAALVFVALARASNLPTKYIDTIRTQWLREGGRPVLGNVYAEVYDTTAERWQLVDPINARLSISFPDSAVLFGVGLDSWDLGISDIDSLHTKYDAFRADWLQKNS